MDIGNSVQPIVECLIAAKVGEPVRQIVICETVNLFDLENTLMVHGE